MGYFYNFFQNYKTEILIFIVALLVRVLILFLAVFSHGKDILYLSDSGGFTDLAHSIASGVGYSRDGGLTPHFLYPPGYSFFLGISEYLSGSFLPALILQVVLSSLVPVIVLMVARMLNLASGVSLLGAWFSVFEPHLVFYSVVYMTEALYGFLFMVSILFFVKFIKNDFTEFIFLSSIFLGLAAYVKVSIYLLIIYFFALIFYFWLVKAEAKKYFLTFFVFLFVFLFLIFPWFLRNYYYSGLWRFSSHEAFNLYVYDGASIISLRDRVSYEDGKKERLNSWQEETGYNALVVYNNLSMADEMYSKGKEFILENVVSSIKLFLLTTASFWTSHNYSYFFTYFFTVVEKPNYVIPPTHLLFQGKIFDAVYETVRVITTPYYILSLMGKIIRFIFMISALIGVLLMYKTGNYTNKSFAIFIGLIFAYFTVMAFGAGFGIEGRVRYPIEPLIMLMAVVGINEIIIKFRNKIDISI